MLLCIKLFDYQCIPYSEGEHQTQIMSNDILKDYGIDIVFECNPKKTEFSSKSTYCNSIKPKNPSDCVLSKEDKNYFKYWCYEELKGFEKGCETFTQESYEDELEFNNYFGIT